MIIGHILQRFGEQVAKTVISQINLTLYTLHFTLYTLHFTLCTLHFTLYTLQQPTQVLDPSSHRSAPNFTHRLKRLNPTLEFRLILCAHNAATLISTNILQHLMVHWPAFLSLIVRYSWIIIMIGATQMVQWMGVGLKLGGGSL